MGRFDARATQPARGPSHMLQWKVLDRLSGKSAPASERFSPPARAHDARLVASDTSALTWIGHATFAFRLAGQMIVTDPVWSRRIGLFARAAAPGIPMAAMPEVQVVTVSHAHYDHLDVPSLRAIGPRARYVVPLGVGRILARAGLPEVVELDWWETAELGALRVTLVPARHWSMRGPFDRNDALWGGFVYEAGGLTTYHAGDTAHFDGFREIGERFAIDYAMLPIGSYEPRWFMEPQHMNPDDAGEAFLALGARTLVAMHWGTFRLTDEPMGEPPERMRAWWRERGLPEDRLWILDIGETRAL